MINDYSGSNSNTILTFASLASLGVLQQSIHSLQEASETSTETLSDSANTLDLNDIESDQALEPPAEEDDNDDENDDLLNTAFIHHPEEGPLFPNEDESSINTTLPDESYDGTLSGLLWENE